MPALIKPATFKKAVTSAGTAEALVASSTLVINAVIQAETSNTGTIFVGANDVDSDNGIELSAGNSVNIQVENPGLIGDLEIDLLDIFIDASVSTDGVKVLYYKKG